MHYTYKDSTTCKGYHTANFFMSEICIYTYPYKWALRCSRRKSIETYIYLITIEYITQSQRVTTTHFVDQNMRTKNKKEYIHNNIHVTRK